MDDKDAAFYEDDGTLRGIDESSGEHSAPHKKLKASADVVNATLEVGDRVVPAPTFGGSGLPASSSNTVLVSAPLAIEQSLENPPKRQRFLQRFSTEEAVAHAFSNS